MIPLNTLAEGAVFKISKIVAKQFESLDINHIVGLDMHLFRKNLFGFAIIQCGSIKYAINNSLAKHIYVKYQ